jgi:hypothetical protein
MVYVVKAMKYLATLLILAVTFGATGCFLKKKKELSEWDRYKDGAEASINSLRDIQSLAFENMDSKSYRAEFEKARGVVDQFLKGSQAEQERASRIAVESALKDLQLVTELMERRNSASNQFSGDKIFATTDAELFNNVKKRYQLGPELLIARQPYYFIDPIINEAWRSARNQLIRAENKLTEEAAAEAKASRRTKSTVSAPKAGGSAPSTTKTGF